MERPYQEVPLIGLIVLHAFYEEQIDHDNYKLMNQLELLNKEIELRLTIPEQDKQITIDEYIRRRKNDTSN